MAQQVLSPTGAASPPALGSPARKGFLACSLATDADLAPAVLRLTLSVVMFPHGAQKMLGWFGGPGFAGSMKSFTEQRGLPSLLAAAIIVLEFFGPLLLLAGLATRWAALGFVALMVGAIVLVHAPQGFFMNWAGTQPGEGFEYHLLAIGIALALAIRGGGCCSLDRLLARSGERARGS